jgi:hypothetical protein
LSWYSPGASKGQGGGKQEQGETTHQGSLTHALPTLHFEDPDLAFIVEVWSRLADECERRLIEIIQTNLSSEV